MRAFLDNLLSPGWWFSVFVVSILASVLAAYAKGWLDRFGSRFSTRWAARTAAKAAERARLAAHLRQSADDRIMWSLDGMRAMQFTLVFLVFSLTLLLPVVILVLVLGLTPAAKWMIRGSLFLGLVCLLMSLRSLFRASEIYEILRASRLNTEGGV